MFDSEIAFRMLPSGSTMTRGELKQASLNLSAELQKLCPQCGERVILAYTPGLDFIVSLLACFDAGLIAVPVALPKRGKSEGYEAIVNDCKPSLILSQSYIKLPDVGVKTLLTDTFEFVKNVTFPSCYFPVAFLQYTSGSTGVPKGVQVTHENIQANCADIKRAFNLDRTSVGVSWLPHYHDMGLIGNILAPWIIGFEQNLMAPAYCIQNVTRLLEAVRDLKATHTGGPNFFYQMLVDREVPQGTDLSSLKVAYCGAEPVKPSTARAFVDKFAKYGLKPNVFTQCYGLAEHTLFVGASNMIDSVGVNLANPEGARVVDPDTFKTCPGSVQGELWLQGASVAEGYWNNPEAFQAYTLEGHGPFLRTGDLGYFNKQGTFVITGRLKDLLIVNGVNYHAHDIESRIEQLVDLLAPESCIVVQLEDDSVVAVVELHRRTPQEAHGSIIADLKAKAGVRIDHVVFMKLPRTTSGKKQRKLAGHLAKCHIDLNNCFSKRV
jgi:acyl-CoA synthetase (AMP-forming)/AMP-acid ligase II